MKRIQIYLALLLINVTLEARAQGDWEIRSANHPYLNDIYFLDVEHGFAAGINGYLAYTTDGAATWNRYTIPAPYANAHFWSIMFLTTNIGFVAASIDGGSHGALFRTTNGGTDWQIVLERPHYLWRMVFPTLSTGYLLGSNFKSESQIFRTLDGGSTWEIVYTSEDGYFIDLAMTDAVNGMALRNPDWFNYQNRFIDITTDGFEHKISRDITSVNFGRQMVVYPLAPNTYLCGYSGIELTTDDGETWTETFPEFFDYQNQVQYIGFAHGQGKVGYAISSDPNTNWSNAIPLIYISTNRGRSWIQKHIELVSYLGPVSSPQEYIAYMVGYYDSLRQSMIIRTRNGFGVSSVNKLASISKEIHVCPNPSTGSTNISFMPSEQKRLLTIEDITGRRLKTITIAPRESSTLVDGLPRGLLIARIGMQACAIVVH